jgi:hypothetical protein
MLTPDEIRRRLQDRRLPVVSKATGVHHKTIRDIRDNEHHNPTYRVLKALSDYLEERP